MAINNLDISIRERLRSYRALLGDEAACVTGLYLVGSIALDDFSPKRSDIDFVAVIERPLTPPLLDLLEGVHRRLNDGVGPALDGFYIERGALQRSPDPSSPVSFNLDGIFHRNGVCFEVNPVTWATLAQKGVVVQGCMPEMLAIHEDAGALREFEMGNLKGYWTDWIRNQRVAWHKADATTAADAIAMSWGVLGVARLCYTLATGAINSKTAAGLWARTSFPAWANLIDHCLAVRNGQAGAMAVDLLDVGLDFIDTAIAYGCGCTSGVHLRSGPEIRNEARRHRPL